MDQTARRSAQTIAIALIVSVVTQLIYINALDGVGIVEGWPLRSTLWTIEVVAFAIMAAAAFAALATDRARAMLWSLLAVSATFNTLQAGIGLSMFLPATEAGEDWAPLMGILLAGSFFFYFLAKALLGLAALGFGRLWWQRGGAVGKAGGIATIAAGLAAATLNGVSLKGGMGITFQAGAAGTAAALLAAMALWMTAGRNSSD